MEAILNTSEPIDALISWVRKKIADSSSTITLIEKTTKKTSFPTVQLSSCMNLGKSLFKPVTDTSMLRATIKDIKSAVTVLVDISNP